MDPDRLEATIDSLKVAHEVMTSVKRQFAIIGYSYGTASIDAALTHAQCVIDHGTAIVQGERREGGAA